MYLKILRFTTSYGTVKALGIFNYPERDQVNIKVTY